MTFRLLPVGDGDGKFHPYFLNLPYVGTLNSKWSYRFKIVPFDRAWKSRSIKIQFEIKYSSKGEFGANIIYVEYLLEH